MGQRIAKRRVVGSVLAAHPLPGEELAAPQLRARGAAKTISGCHFRCRRRSRCRLHRRSRRCHPCPYHPPGYPVGWCHQRTCCHCFQSRPALPCRSRRAAGRGPDPSHSARAPLALPNLARPDPSSRRRRVAAGSVACRGWCRSAHRRRQQPEGLCLAPRPRELTSSLRLLASSSGVGQVRDASSGSFAREIIAGQSDVHPTVVTAADVAGDKDGICRRRDLCWSAWPAVARSNVLPIK